MPNFQGPSLPHFSFGECVAQFMWVGAALQNFFNIRFDVQACQLQLSEASYSDSVATLIQTTFQTTLTPSVSLKKSAYYEICAGCKM